MAMERQFSPQLLIARKDEARGLPDRSPHSPRSPLPIFADLPSLAKTQAHATQQAESTVTFKNPEPFSSEPTAKQVIPHYVTDQQHRKRQLLGHWESVQPIQTLGEDRRRSSVLSTFDRYRRHSDMTSPGGLISRLGDFNMSTPHRNSFALGSSPIVEASRSQLLTGVAELDLKGLETSAPRRYSYNRAKAIGRFYSTGFPRLACSYMECAATADALINPVRLRSSSAVPSDVNFSEKNNAGSISDDSNWVTIRARVTPKARDKKPFVIQRRFDIDAMKASALQRRNSKNNNEKLSDRKANPESSSATSAEICRASPTRKDSLGPNVLSVRRDSILEKRHERMPIRKRSH